MTSLQHLLPAPDRSPRCSDHARALAVDPGGSAIRADRVVLAETPGPWPKPVFDHPALAAINPILKQATVPTRTLAYLHRSGDDPAQNTADHPAPNPGDDPAQNTADHPASVITFDRLSPVIERRFRPRSLDEALALAIALAEDDIEALDVMADSRTELATPVLLVCTQGSHDVCCGSDGARFAAEAETIAGLTVYRVSHTGGHRFAPTAMTLPDGRMWADLDLELLQRVLTNTGETAAVVDRCRGWWGADAGAAQVAERAVLGTVGWEFESMCRTVTPIELGADATERSAERSADHHGRWLVSTDERSWEVSVAVGRAVPTIACRQPGGLPAKPSVEYAVERIVER